MTMASLSAYLQIRDGCAAELCALRRRPGSAIMVFNKEATTSTNSLRSLPTENTHLISFIHDSSLSSTPKTFANIFIAIVGADVLGLPYTFLRTDWLTSFLMIFFVAVLAYHCMMLLIDTRKKLESPLKHSKIASFGNLNFDVCGPIGRFIVDTMIFLSQAGFCVGYLIFIGNTLGLGHMKGKAIYKMNKNEYMNREGEDE